MKGKWKKKEKKIRLCGLFVFTTEVGDFKLILVSYSNLFTIWLIAENAPVFIYLFIVIRFYAILTLLLLFFLLSVFPSEVGTRVTFLRY